jgi:hypothetical protein
MSLSRQELSSRRWCGYLRATKNVAFNLTSYELPELRVSTAEVNYLGYAIEVPTFVRAQDKTVTFEYILSSDWHQWKLLFSWLNKVTKEEGVGAGYTNVNQINVPIHIIMLSEFKKPVLDVAYENCWIKSMGPIRLDYQDGDAPVVKHSFTVSYAFFSVTDPTEANT